MKKNLPMIYVKSQCNDDETDNRFYEKVGRFPEIEEDEAPYRLLCNEYPNAEQKIWSTSYCYN